MTDSQRCETAGEHQTTTRHTSKECPVNSPATTFEEIAEAQGWNDATRLQILREFIDTDTRLVGYAQHIADNENEEASGLPDLTMEVHGEYYGNAYPESAEFRVRLTTLVPGDRYLLTAETTDGTEVTTVPLGEAEVDGIAKVAGTSHSLDVYDGDWTIPVGIDRTVHWDLSDATHNIRLNEQQIDEIYQWLRYATGEDEYTGGEDWEY